MRSVSFRFNPFSSNSVEGSTPFIAYYSGVDLQHISFFVFPYDFELLQLLKAPPDDFGARVLVPGGPTIAAVLAPIDVGEESDAGSGANINFPG